ncbi:hypothetical protein SLEP1_g27753 [Rubroshorea leprosula]|uniref:ATP synthase F0 subunit 8 n=1 Tax=Rubroshorea leprosula TaxID=152421 RepID=A0AAV5K0S2_9ROSI|nr:hypothetical protein SLEP1_g27753 [Rubroshorea leprosula]
MTLPGLSAFGSLSGDPFGFPVFLLFVFLCFLVWFVFLCFLVWFVFQIWRPLAFPIDLGRCSLIFQIWPRRTGSLLRRPRDFAPSSPE